MKSLTMYFRCAGEYISEQTQKEPTIPPSPPCILNSNSRLLRPCCNLQHQDLIRGKENIHLLNFVHTVSLIAVNGINSHQ